MADAELTERMARVGGILEENRSRLDYVQNDLRETNRRIDETNQHLDKSLEALRKEMRSNFLWLLGVMLGILIPMWVSIILAILITR